MKAITTIFESILGNDDSIIWTPSEGPTEFNASTASSKGWGWGTFEGNKGWGWGT